MMLNARVDAADWLVSPLPLRRGEDKGEGFSASRAYPCITLTSPLPFEGRGNHAEDCEMLELLVG